MFHSSTRKQHMSPPPVHDRKAAKNTVDSEFASPVSSAMKEEENNRSSGPLYSVEESYPASLEIPRLATPVSLSRFSPTVSTAKLPPGRCGRFHIRHRRSQSDDLDTARRALSLTPSPIRKSRPSVGHFSLKRRRNTTCFGILVFVSISFATLSFALYLFKHQEQDFHNDPATVPEESSVDSLLRNVSTEATTNKERKGEASAPRLVYFDERHGFDGEFHPRPLEDDLTLHAPPGEEAMPQDGFTADHHDENCVYLSEWQTSSFPNCNMLHELELQAAGRNAGKNADFEDSVSHMGNGWFRDAWQVNLGANNETVVLKTLRLEREFYSEFYELHRRDAVAMERLTFSPFVMDIYGYCGQSAINEIASFGHGGLTNLELFDRQLRGKESPQALFVKLQVAASVAVGVAHVHQVNGADAIPAMVHYDLNPRNIAIVKNGKPKLNDFNTAEFLRINPKTNETCGFPSRLHEPWWRAPEEVVIPKPGELRLVNEKADVYSLGNLLYHVLTSHSPRGKMNKQKRLDIVRFEVANGQPPALHKMYINSDDPIVLAIKKAMKLCFVLDPRKRASAKEVASVLLEALLDLKTKHPEIATSHNE